MHEVPGPLTGKTTRTRVCLTDTAGDQIVIYLAGSWKGRFGDATRRAEKLLEARLGDLTPTIVGAELEEV